MSRSMAWRKDRAAAPAWPAPRKGYMSQKVARAFRLGSWLLLLGILASLAPGPSHAVNGLNLIGSGGISSGLAGADTAVATDFTAMNTNPAGMSQLKDRHAGLAMTMIIPQLQFENSGGVRDGENDVLLIPNLGYVHPIPGTRLTLGIGFFTVGGTASDFRDIQTVPALGGTRDKTSTIIRHYKLTPSLAYEVTDRLSLGASLAIGYSDVALKVAPNTPLGFETQGTCDRANGVALPGSCAYALGFVPKIGLMYQPHETVTLGLTYTFKSTYAYDGDTVVRNQLGIGKVTYDADLSGLKWADDIAFGIALRPSQRLLIATKVQWINWDAALNTVFLNLKNGDNPAMPTDTIVLQYNWDSQWVVAVGAAYDVTDRFNIRGGYNYGNDPVPDATLDPTNLNITEHHIVAGAAYRVRPNLMLDGAFNYTVTNRRDLVSNFFGASTVEAGGYDVTLSLTYWR